MPSAEEKDLIRATLDNLRSAMSGFRTRRAQFEMIGVVAQTLARARDAEAPINDGENFAVVNAGTGTGKSIAGLTPAIVMAKSRGKKLIVATSTVALQEQYHERDIPILRECLPLEFSVAVAKGRRRYLCPARLVSKLAEVQQQTLDLDKTASLPKDQDPRRRKMLIDVAEAFEGERWNGDRDELALPVPDRIWDELTTERRGCAGKHCAHFARCPFYAARQRAKDADVILTNQDLVLASLDMVAGSVLPSPSESLYIVDEAHNLVAKAIGHFASKHTVHGAAEWIGDTAVTTRDIVLGLRLDEALYREVHQLCDALEADLEDLYAAIQSTRAFEEKPTRRFRNGVLPDWMQAIGTNILGRARALQQAQETLREQMLMRAQEESQMVTGLLSSHGFFAEKIDHLVATWALMLSDDREAGVPTARWIERHDLEPAGRDYAVCASPISAAANLQRLLWSRASAVVLTSASLALCGTFGLFLSQSGLSRYKRVRTLDVASPFDYRNRARLVVPRMMNDPRQREAHLEEVVNRLPALVTTRGTLVLFGSRTMMKTVHPRIPEDLRRITLMQGSMPKMEMLARHRAEIDRGGRSVLFGLASMAEGVDLAGEYCTHVVIAKLFFNTPDSPLEEARSEWIESSGRSAFLELTVPQAGIRLQQAVGRLLRTHDDYGTVTVLDRRLITTRWGQILLRGLPDFAREFGKQATSAHASATHG